MVKHGFTKHDEVPVNRLDSLIAQGEVEFAEGENVVVKIDVEGFEYLALQGATRFLDRMKPLTVHAEYVPLMIQRAAQSVGASADSAKHSPADFLAYMKEKGYSNFMEPLGGPKKVFGQQYEAIFTRQI